jgi:hypothetical protein
MATEPNQLPFSQEHQRAEMLAAQFMAQSNISIMQENSSAGLVTFIRNENQIISQKDIL